MIGRLSSRGLLAWSLLFLLVVFGAYVFHSRQSSFPKGDRSCITQEEERVVRGRSMAGVLEEGSVVKVFYGFYNCNPVRRNDIVVYDFAANSDPVVKLAAGLPGDTFGLDVSGSPDWQSLIINSEKVLSPSGEPHLVHRTNDRFRLYVRDYGAGIPPDTYLLLGTNPLGSADSVEIGLVHKSDILGKAVRR